MTSMNRLSGLVSMKEALEVVFWSFAFCCCHYRLGLPAVTHPLPDQASFRLQAGTRLRTLGRTTSHCHGLDPGALLLGMPHRLGWAIWDLKQHARLPRLQCFTPAGCQLAPL